MHGDIGSSCKRLHALLGSSMGMGKEEESSNFCKWCQNWPETLSFDVSREGDAKGDAKWTFIWAVNSAKKTPLRYSCYIWSIYHMWQLGRRAAASVAGMEVEQPRRISPRRTTPAWSCWIFYCFRIITFSFNYYRFSFFFSMADFPFLSFFSLLFFLDCLLSQRFFPSLLLHTLFVSVVLVVFVLFLFCSFSFVSSVDNFIYCLCFFALSLLLLLVRLF